MGQTSKITIYFGSPCNLNEGLQKIWRQHKFSNTYIIFFKLQFRNLFDIAHGLK